MPKKATNLELDSRLVAFLLLYQKICIIKLMEYGKICKINKSNSLKICTNY